MQERVTTALDALGLVLIAAGVSGGAYPFIGWWSLCASGVVVLCGSGWAAWQARRPVKAPA